jgi:hypothetical protein
MSVYEQFKTLQEELKTFKKASADKDAPSFFYFVEFCGKVKTASDTLFDENAAPPFQESDDSAKNLKTVFAIRRISQKKMADQKLFSRASEPPISRIWTTDGVDENLDRIKMLEQAAGAKTETLNKIESAVSEQMTLSNYKNFRSTLLQGLEGKTRNSMSSIDSLIPMKYRAFIGKSDIQMLDTLFNFLSNEIGSEEIAEIEKMNYVEFKYALLMILTAMRITYEFPPNYEVYRFCAMFPKNPNENSGLVQKLADLIDFTNSKMSNLIKSAKMYEKFEQHELKVIGK